MYKATALLIMVLFMVTSVVAQRRPQNKTQVVRMVDKINSDPSLRKVTLNNQAWQKGIKGGRLTGFYKDSLLVKVVRRVRDSGGIEVVTFYFSGNELIYVHERYDMFYYDEKKKAQRTDSLERNFDGSYYFSGKKMMDATTLGHNRFEDDSISAEEVWPREAAVCKRLLARGKE
ncbi:hypothetical protein [Chitinophaga varians]|uniref:hypothetical protein n=1 Tax=Chitinophaga varians TaxID=2202339 RepID=UPI00165F276B|nr:hypothetical protein [Chitinophaga varians]MBC9909973.1 hypothetical protein [Chitinophaga varians]